MSLKVRENRLRRMAERQGLQLVKSRRRDPLARDFGLYLLVENSKRGASSGDFEGGQGLTLDQVEESLSHK